MDIVIKILQFILSFSLLVFVHELGHFLTARMFGIRVEKFYIFFNPAIVKFKIGHTEYGIGSIPFGGYCKIAGMVDESMDTAYQSQEPKDYEFRSKPAWQRLIVMLGGVLMNLVLAVLIYIGMSWAWGDQYIANDDVKYGYSFNELAQEIGFENGDYILTINGKHLESTMDVRFEMLINQGHSVEVIRDGKPVTINIPKGYFERMSQSPDFLYERVPFVVDSVISGTGAAFAGVIKGDSALAVNGKAITFFDEVKSALTESRGNEIDVTFGRDSSGVMTEVTLPINVSEDGTIGIYPKAAAYIPISTKNYTFLESVPVGIKRTGSEIGRYWRQIKLIFSPQTKAYKSLGGPLLIGSIFPDVWNWQVFWNITAFLSLVLAVMNMLPIPGLDGGHVMFTLYEMITRRKPNDKFLEYATMIGFMFLFTLIIYATWNDISRIFFN